MAAAITDAHLLLQLVLLCSHTRSASLTCCCTHTINHDTLNVCAGERPGGRFGDKKMGPGGDFNPEFQGQGGRAGGEGGQDGYRRSGFGRGGGAN
jgi:hypothetical protein